MRSKNKLGRVIEPYIYLLPSAIFLIVFTFYPFIKNVIQSFFTVNSFGIVREFSGLHNYQVLLGDPKFIKAIGNTLLYVAVTVPLSIVVGLLLALMARKRKPLSSVYEAAYSLPMAMSMSVVAMIFQLALNPSLGIINKLLNTNISWLKTEATAFWCIMFIQIWLNIGFDFLFLLSALRGISGEILESAEMDGATGFTRLTKIIIPLISPTILFLLTSSIAKAMMAGGLTLILSQTPGTSAGSTGGPNGSTETIVSYLYRETIIGQNYNLGYAAGVIGFLIAFVLIVISFVYEKKGVHYD